MKRSRGIPRHQRSSPTPATVAKATWSDSQHSISGNGIKRCTYCSLPFLSSFIGEHRISCENLDIISGQRARSVSQITGSESVSSWRKLGSGVKRPKFKLEAAELSEISCGLPEKTKPTTGHKLSASRPWSKTRVPPSWISPPGPARRQLLAGL